MKKQVVSKVVAIAVATSLVTSVLVGCGNVSADTADTDTQGQI